MALTGNVTRWFNRKGYGFINVMTSDSEHVGKDLFVHLSGITISNDGYKSLYPGEYVSFDVDKTGDGRFTCVNLTGVLGGPLLIEHSEYRYKYFQKNPRSRDTYNDESNITHNEEKVESSTEQAESSVEQVESPTEQAKSPTEQVESPTEQVESSVEVDENDPEQQ